MIRTARHDFVGTMLDADWHPIGRRIFARGVSGATGSGAELCDVLEWHDDSLFFRVDNGVRVYLQLDLGKSGHRERLSAFRTLLSVLYKAGSNPFFLSFSKILP